MGGAGSMDDFEHSAQSTECGDVEVTQRGGSSARFHQTDRGDEFSGVVTDFPTRIDDRVLQCLMIAFTVVVLNEFTHRSSQGSDTEEDHAVQALRLDGEHSSFSESAAVGRSVRRHHAFDAVIIQHGAELLGELAIIVEDQERCSAQIIAIRIGEIPRDLRHEVTARSVDSADFLDYAHVAKINGEWKIVNVLWVPHKN